MLRAHARMITATKWLSVELGRFVDRRSVRSAHIKRSENLTCARSDSDSRVAATRRVRLTDAFTTVPLSAHGEHLAATVTRAQCRKQTGGEGVRGGSAVGQPTSLIFASYRWSLCVLPPRLHSHGLLYNRCYYIGVHGTAYAKSLKVTNPSYHVCSL